MPWVVLLVFNFLISVITSSVDFLQKLNISPVAIFLLVSILGCFLYLKIAFRTRYEILSSGGSVQLKSVLLLFELLLNNSSLKLLIASNIFFI